MTEMVLHDGRVVDVGSYEWRLEGMAMELCDMPDARLRELWIEDFEMRRGRRQAEPLRERVRAIFAARVVK